MIGARIDNRVPWGHLDACLSMSPPIKILSTQNKGPRVYEKSIHFA